MSSGASRGLRCREPGGGVHHVTLPRRALGATPQRLPLPESPMAAVLDMMRAGEDSKEGSGGAATLSPSTLPCRLLPLEPPDPP